MSDKVKLIAIERTWCAGWHNPGEEFEAIPSNANLLVKTHKARIKAEKGDHRTSKPKEVKTEK